MVNMKPNGQVLICDFEKSGSLLMYKIIKSIQVQNNCFKTYSSQVGLKEVIEAICSPYLQNLIIPERDLLLKIDDNLNLAFPHPDLASLPVEINLLDSISSLVHTHISLDYISEKTNFFHSRSIIYIYRDIRDVINSWLHYAIQPIVVRRNPKYQHLTIQSLLSEREIINQKLINWKAHVEHAFSFGNLIHMVNFKKLVSDKKETIELILKFLNYKANIDIILEDTSFDKMKRESPQHVRSGTSGEWSKLFDPILLENIKKICGSTLVKLGYESDLNWSPN